MDRIKKPILDLTKDEFKYTQTTLGGPTYKHNMKRGRPEVDDANKKLPTDRIKCKVCGKEYFRSGATKHKRTVFHKERERINEKLLGFLID